jgi:hypothetical protein
MKMRDISSQPLFLAIREVFAIRILSFDHVLHLEYFSSLHYHLYYKLHGSTADPKNKCMEIGFVEVTLNLR